MHLFSGLIFVAEMVHWKFLYSDDLLYTCVSVCLVNVIRCVKWDINNNFKS